MQRSGNGDAHLAPQRQNGLSISRRRRRLLGEEPVAPLIHVPSSVDTSGMCGVHRQVAQRHVPQERGHLRCTDLGRIRLVRGNDASSIGISYRVGVREMMGV